MVPRETVDRLGWDEVRQYAKLAAQAKAAHEGVAIGELIREVLTSWVVNDQSGYIPHPADGTEEYRGIELTYQVDTSVTPVRQ